jgi:hypothetical protein
MIKFFRHIRQNLIMENKTGKYLKYAIGEIILVVIGILIALSINNWNTKQSLKQRGAELLSGIRSDLQKDTIDINENILSYQKILVSDSILLHHLVDKQPLTTQIETIIIDLSNYDAKLDLYTNFYETLKQEGLSRVDNRDIRNKIASLYGWFYPNTIYAENQRENLDYYSFIFGYLKNVLEVDAASLKENTATISADAYDRILEDKNFHYQLLRMQQMHNDLLERHLALRAMILDLITDIDRELKET